MRLTFRKEEDGRVVELSSDSTDDLCFWTTQADMFMDFLRGQSYVIPYNRLGHYINDRWNERISAEADKEEEKQESVD